MFETLSLLTLQQYWWFIVALLGGLFVFLMFVQGGQTLLNTLAKTETEKNVIIASLGRKWELGFTSLVMFGGALLAAFPLLYAVSFGTSTLPPSEVNFNALRRRLLIIFSNLSTSTQQIIFSFSELKSRLIFF